MAAQSPREPRGFAAVRAQFGRERTAEIAERGGQTQRPTRTTANASFLDNNRYGGTIASKRPNVTTNLCAPTYLHHGSIQAHRRTFARAGDMAEEMKPPRVTLYSRPQVLAALRSSSPNFIVTAVDAFLGQPTRRFSSAFSVPQCGKPTVSTTTRWSAPCVPPTTAMRSYQTHASHAKMAPDTHTSNHGHHLKTIKPESYRCSI